MKAIRSATSAFGLLIIGSTAVVPKAFADPVTFVQVYQITSSATPCSVLCTSTISDTAITLAPTTFTDGSRNIVTSGSVSAGALKSSLAGNIGAELDAGMSDTYTVHGSASGPFDITVTFSASGTAGTVPVSPTLNFRIGANVTLNIGTLSFADLGLSAPYPQVSAFTASAHSQLIFPTIVSAATFDPFSLSATYTKTVSVGDVFDVAYLMQSIYADGSIDLSHTGTISFSTPDGVYLTSALGGAFGDVPTTVGVPGPVAGAGLPGLLAGFGALLAWYRKRRAVAI